MSGKTLRRTLYGLLILVACSSITRAQSGPSTEITSPAADQVLTELTSIAGTVSIKRANVKIAIGKQESDQVWECNQKHLCGWKTGPTGTWQLADVSGANWSAPSWFLPPASSLPNANYVIYVYAEGVYSGGLTVAGPQT